MTPQERRNHMLQHDAQDPYDPIHPNGGVVDVWLMDDQTIPCDPVLTNAVIDAVDITCQDPKRGGVRNRTKTHAVLYASPQELR